MFRPDLVQLAAVGGKDDFENGSVAEGCDIDPPTNSTSNTWTTLKKLLFMAFIL